MWTRAKRNHLKTHLPPLKVTSGKRLCHARPDHIAQTGKKKKEIGRVTVNTGRSSSTPELIYRSAAIHTPIRCVCVCVSLTCRPGSPLPPPQRVVGWCKSQRRAAELWRGSFEPMGTLWSRERRKTHACCYLRCT